MKPARMPSTASVREFCTTASTHSPATSAMELTKAKPGGIRSKRLNAAKMVSSSTPMAPPCNANANRRRRSRWCQPKASRPSAPTVMPARRSSIGNTSQPWSLTYFSSAATPASSTSMPILTGTLPSVNQRLTAPMPRSMKLGSAGSEGSGGCTGIGGTGGGAAGRGTGASTGAASRSGGCGGRGAAAATGRRNGGSALAAGVAAARSGVGVLAAGQAVAGAAAIALSSAATRRRRPEIITSATTSSSGMANRTSTTRAISASIACFHCVPAPQRQRSTAPCYDRVGPINDEPRPGRGPSAIYAGLTWRR